MCPLTNVCAWIRHKSRSRMRGSLRDRKRAQCLSNLRAHCGRRTLCTRIPWAPCESASLARQGSSGKVRTSPWGTRTQRSPCYRPRARQAPHTPCGVACLGRSCPACTRTDAHATAPYARRDHRNVDAIRRIGLQCEKTKENNGSAHLLSETDADDSFSLSFAQKRSRCVLDGSCGSTLSQKCGFTVALLCGWSPRPLERGRDAAKAVWLAAVVKSRERKAQRLAAFSLSMESTTAGERRLSGARVF